MNTTTLDREQVFLVYATFAGDCERTAAAVGLRGVDILKVAEEDGWLARLRPILELKKSSRPGDFERACNRALNFAQAHRYRLFLERVIQKLVLMNDDELADYLFSCETSKMGAVLKKLATRGLADLASAMEKAQALSYQALSDTATDRARRDETADSEESGGELHAQIAKAMSVVRESRSARALLLDAQIQIAENAVIAAKKPVNPNDDDDH